MKVDMTRNALRRLNHIKDHFGGPNNPQRGIDKVDQLLERTFLLENNPLLGKEEIYLEHLNRGHRSLVVPKYHKIVYRIEGDEIIVTDFFDTRRGTDKMKP